MDLRRETGKKLRSVAWDDQQIARQRRLFTSSNRMGKKKKQALE